MAPKAKTKRTTVGRINAEALAFTAGDDVQLDLNLVEADCVGSAAHVTMLARMKVKPPVFSKAEAGKVLRELVAIMRSARKGTFRITLEDQDVHLAVERVLTHKLGDLGKRVHTARSRNDQVAVDLRLYGKEQLLATIYEGATLCTKLLACGRKHAAVPMVGRTHMQPAMPSSVGLWASAHAETLLDDLAGLMHAYDLNNQCPLGSAAGYGVPLPIDRQLVSDLLGFSRPCHSVLYANNSRGKLESVILAAMHQVMLSLSRLAQDLMIYMMPEFGYFTCPETFGTGSSIMPQKNNPDVLELVRAKASAVAGNAAAVSGLVQGLPGGYNRDLQEAKKPFLEGMATTRACLRIMAPLIAGLKVNRKALAAGFTPAVFATDKAIELVGQGMPFRDAYQYVKDHLSELDGMDPGASIAAKTHLGATANIDFDALDTRASEAVLFAIEEQKDFHQAVSKLLGVTYPLGG